VGLLLLREQSVCGIAVVEGANCVWDCCCTGSKLVVRVLLYREQIGFGIAAVKGAKCVGVVL